MSYNRKKVYYIEGEWGGKECKVCGHFRNWWEFYNSKSGFKGVHSTCKNCYNKYGKKRYAEKREDILQQNKEYYLDKKEELSLYHKQHYLDNREDILENRKEYAASPALFNTYAHQLTIEEQPRETDNGYLEVKCAHSECREYFIPTIQQVNNRIKALNGQKGGEHRLYCSEICKQECSLYGQVKYPKGFKTSNTIKRSFPVEFRNMVLERDNYQCVICGSTDNLTVHHSDPFATCKMFENDMDGAFTLCEEHDKKAHSISGCTLPELRKASQEMIKELQEKGINLNEVPEWALDKY